MKNDISNTKAFTIRIYGILISQNNELLISEEWYKNMKFTKFPGGGLELGEGSIDCLKREFKEELGLEIQVTSHFYTTDFFVVSAFNPEVQVLSVYYMVQPSHMPDLPKRQLNTKLAKDEVMKFVPLASLQADTFFSFPIDRHVGKLLWEKLKS
ncbi:MAG: NUDIX domain-containing protein [Bacteroidia bacterium]